MEISESKKWKMWKAILDIKTCRDCRKKHGKIYEIKEKVVPPPPLNWSCRCQIVRLRAILAGNATKLGAMGADWWIKYYGKLPDYYVGKSEAEKAGWIGEEGNLNYRTGYRGNDCIVYSSDGLIFVTYDHYKTFIEIK